MVAVVAGASVIEQAEDWDGQCRRLADAVRWYAGAKGIALVPQCRKALEQGAVVASTVEMRVAAARVVRCVKTTNGCTRGVRASHQRCLGGKCHAGAHEVGRDGVELRDFVRATRYEKTFGVACLVLDDRARCVAGRLVVLEQLGGLI